jgi:hypothetical protein
MVAAVEVRLMELGLTLQLGIQELLCLLGQAARAVVVQEQGSLQATAQ